MQNLQENLDRLAEGELSVDETRVLFDELDKDPSQWRQCAITLLEADQWRRAMTKMVSNDGFHLEAESNTPVALPVALPTASTSRFASVRYWASIAAAVAVAFSLGHLLTSPPDVASTTQVVAQRGTEASDPQSSRPLTSGQAESSNRDLGSASAGRSPSQDAITVWTVGRNGKRQSMEIPLRESAWLNEKLNQQYGPVISENVKKQLREDGYQVEARRRFATVNVDGGGSFLLPLDESRLVSFKEVSY
jgi:hypothetical protein